MFGTHAARGMPMCFICGRDPNAWCTEYHLPTARDRVRTMREDADHAENEIKRYEIAAAASMTEK